MVADQQVVEIAAPQAGDVDQDIGVAPAVDGALRGQAGGHAEAIRIGVGIVGIISRDQRGGVDAAQGVGALHAHEEGDHGEVAAGGGADVLALQVIHQAGADQHLDVVAGADALDVAEAVDDGASQQAGGDALYGRAVAVEIDPVVAFAPEIAVDAGAAAQSVVACATVQCVVAAAAIEPVGAVAADDLVVVGRAADGLDQHQRVDAAEAVAGAIGGDAEAAQHQGGGAEVDVDRAVVTAIVGGDAGVDGGGAQRVGAGIAAKVAAAAVGEDDACQVVDIAGAVDRFHVGKGVGVAGAVGGGAGGEVGDHADGWRDVAVVVRPHVVAQRIVAAAAVDHVIAAERDEVVVVVVA